MEILRSKPNTQVKWASKVILREDIFLITNSYGSSLQKTALEKVHKRIGQSLKGMWQLLGKAGVQASVFCSLTVQSHGHLPSVKITEASLKKSKKLQNHWKINNGKCTMNIFICTF